MKFVQQAKLVAKLAAAWRSQYWSGSRIAEWQGARLVETLRHAVTHVPFYRELGIRAADIQSPADLARFPILTKAEIQRQGSRMLTEGLAPSDLHWSRTSGSSGEPTSTAFDHDAWLMTRYVLKIRRLFALTGFRPGQRVLIVTEARPEELGELGEAAPGGVPGFRQKFISIHAPFEQHVETLISWRPTALYAYPSWLTELLDTARAMRRELPKIPVVFTSSEVLTMGVRARVRSALGCKVCDIYGSTEFKEVAWQCEHGRYHVNFESVWIEPLPLDRPGPLVISTVVNRAMPLIRFGVGDEAIGALESCACGRHSGVISTVNGREADVIELPGGHRISPYLLTTEIERDERLIQYRVVETGPGQFRVEMVGGSAPDPRRDADLCARLTALTRGKGRFQLARVPRLKRARSGKRSVFLREAQDV